MKRPADESSEHGRKAQKKHHQSTPGGASAWAKGKRPRTASGQDTPGSCTDDTKRQKEVHIQVGKYLLEKFSIPAFRSHATIGLIDRDRIQLYHINHSVILVSSAINFAFKDRDGLDKLIAIIIAFTRLSLRDNGVLHSLGDGDLFQDNQKLSTTKEGKDHDSASLVQNDNGLVLKKDGKSLTLKLRKVLSHEPSLVGRATAVLHATSLEGSQLAVKISWPGTGRTPETEFLEEAMKCALETPNKWAVKHLPNVVFDIDVDFDSNSTHGKVASLFKEAELLNGEYEYEERTLRIIVQERLHPLNALTDAKEIAQVLVDVMGSTYFRSPPGNRTLTLSQFTDGCTR